MGRLSTAERDERQRLLAAYSRRAIHGVRAQRLRLTDSDMPFDFDLDYYAHSCWQLREATKMAIRTLQMDELKPELAKIDLAIPRLREYRNAMTHALDFDAGLAWVGPSVVHLRPGGAVEDVLDTRYYQHEAIEDLFAAVIAILDPDSEATRIALGGRLPPA